MYNDSEKPHERTPSVSKSRYRNLRQYKNMSDEEFEEEFSKLQLGASTNQEFEARIERKIQKFSEDYDLDDLNYNDKMVLRALCQAIINLEDMENIHYRLRASGINEGNLLLLEKISKTMSDLRSDISKLQTDLNITRRVRTTGKEQSMLDFIEDMKSKAKQFYEAKMSYILCPKCNMLLGTIWTLYPGEDRNRIILYCNRELDNGEVCGTKVMVSTKELLRNKATNVSGILPDTL